MLELEDSGVRIISRRCPQCGFPYLLMDEQGVECPKCTWWDGPESLQEYREGAKCNSAQTGYGAR